jgi:chaperone LolA
MKRRADARWILLSFLLGAPAWGALPLTQVLDRMEQAQLALEDARFEFSQKMTQGDFPEQRVTGEVQIKKPQSLRVVQTSPDKQVLISDGETFWLYSPAQNQQLTGDWKAWLKRSQFPLPLIDFLGTFTPERWRSQYRVLFGGHQDKEYELRFKPLKPGLQPLTLWVSEDTFLPVRGRLTGDQMRIDVTLKNVKTNTGLAASVFSTAVPAGTQEVPLTF